jgi:SAM-dependent methyltransferase
MDDRPACLKEHWDAFCNEGVVAAYAYRPPYPDEAIDGLAGLVSSSASVVDIGCGTGEIARRLAPCFSRVDAIDASTAMIRRGQQSANGTHPGLQWICARVEDWQFTTTYDLAVAAGSLHWMQWSVVLPKLAQALGAHGLLAILPDGGASPVRVPWQPSLTSLIGEYSAMRNWVPVDVVQEIAGRGLFQETHRFSTAPVAFRQSVDEYVEYMHSQAGLSRAKMAAEAVAEFDRHLRNLVEPYQDVDCHLTFEVTSTVVCGRPLRGQS